MCDGRAVFYLLVQLMCNLFLDILSMFILLWKAQLQVCVCVYVRLRGSGKYFSCVAVEEALELVRIFSC